MFSSAYLLWGQIECFMVSKEETIYWCNSSAWRTVGECWQNARASTLLFVVSGLNSDYGRDVGWRREFYNLWDSFINEGILLNCSVRLGDTISPAEVFETTAVITALYPCRFFRCLHPGPQHHLWGKKGVPALEDCSCFRTLQLTIIWEVSQMIGG